MTKKEARDILSSYIEKYGEIPSVFDSIQLAKAVLLLKEELEDIINE